MITTPFNKKKGNIGSFWSISKAIRKTPELCQPPNDPASFQWVEEFSTHTVPMGQQLQMLEGSRSLFVYYCSYLQERKNRDAFQARREVALRLLHHVFFHSSLTA